MTDLAKQEVTIKDLVQKVTLNGFSPALIKEYTKEEKRQLRNELFLYATAKQETISSDTIEVWSQTFQEMQLEYSEAVKRIRVAKMSKRYGTATEFGDFMSKTTDEINKEYFSFYKHEIPKYKTYQCKACNLTTRLATGDKIPNHKNPVSDMECHGTYEAIF